MAIERFEDLKSWQAARALEQIVYRLTKHDAFRTDRGLCWQIQEAAVSAMGNIAEGHGRYSFEEMRRFLDIARGSCREAQSHLYVALDQAYITQAEFDAAYQQTEAVAQLINGMVDNLLHQIANRPERSGAPPFRRSPGRRAS